MNDSLQVQADQIPADETMLKLLAGNIASGKSTWTKKRAAAGWITIEIDVLPHAIHGGRYCWEEGIPGRGNALARQILTAAARAARPVVLDATN